MILVAVLLLTEFVVQQFRAVAVTDLMTVLVAVTAQMLSLPFLEAASDQSCALIADLLVVAVG